MKMRTIIRIHTLFIYILINQISFQLQMEKISMLVIFAVMLYYLSSIKREVWKIQAWTGLQPLRTAQVA